MLFVFSLKRKLLRYYFFLFITCEKINVKVKKEINDVKHLSVESLYLYADHVFDLRIGRMK